MPDDFKDFYNEILQSSVKANLPKAILERFKVISCLAFGDAKELYLAIDKQNGRQAILRVTKNESGEDALTEARVLKSLDHPAIAKVLGEWSKDGRGFLAREYFEGITLGEYVRGSGTRPVKEIIDLAIQISDILEYLQKRKPPVTHRDIKPENIVLTPDGDIKLIDFGIARVFVEDADSDTRIIGPKYYMAPEQYGGTQSDTRSDIYSLGMVMIYLATGIPDKGKAKYEIANREFMSVVLKCVRFDPDARFQSAHELKEKLLFIKNGGKKRLLSIILVGLLSISFIAAVYALSDGWGYENGFDYGEKHGYDSGYSSGFTDGRAEGFELGYDETMADIYAEKMRQYDKDAALYFTEMPNGNTGGNLINRGIAVGYEDYIFYAVDGNVIRMNLDGGAETVHCNHNASQLCLAGGYLYHVNEKDAEIYKSPVQGGECVKLERASDESVDNMRVYDGSIYYTSSLANPGLYKTGLNGGATEHVNELPKLKYFDIAGDELFFCADGTYDPSLYKSNLDGSDLTLLDDRNINRITVVGQSVFYSSYADNSLILRMNTDGTGCEEIYVATANYLNVSPYGLFFSDGWRNGHLYRASLDGRTVTQLNDIHSSYINVASGWVFYNDDNDDLYRMRVDGSENTRLSMPKEAPIGGDASQSGGENP